MSAHVRLAARWLTAFGLAAAAGIVDGGAQEIAAEADLVRRAEALLLGTAGRYDRDGADRLLEQAAEAGDPRATFRLAVLSHFGTDGRPRDRAAAAAAAGDTIDRVAASAAAGDSYAVYLLAMGRLGGLGVARDALAARAGFSTAAAAGDLWALHNIGWMDSVGRGRDQPDALAAIESFRAAAERGNAASQVALARLLFDRRSEGDCAAAVAWLERAASIGYPFAENELGARLLERGTGCVEPDPGRARALLGRAAAFGLAPARYLLACSLLTGAGGEPEPARAIEQLEAAAADRHAGAIELLAWLHAVGDVVPQSPEASARWRSLAAGLGYGRFGSLPGVRNPWDPPSRAYFEASIFALERSARAGSSPAAALLAGLYFDGLGVEPDPETGLEWARRARSDAEAAGVLGRALLEGRGAARDLQAGARELRRCAEMGSARCQHELAELLFEGRGVEPDPEAALRWSEAAAAQGSFVAIRRLARTHDEGLHGVPRDEASALRWMLLRAAVGDLEARGWLLYRGYDPDRALEPE
jgi:TPR repeat protein